MRVIDLWRYPVKSLLGERVTAAELVADGMVGDRSWVMLDVATGRVLTGRREPRLLFASAKLEADGRPRIALPNGDNLVGCGEATDEALTRWLGKPVQLVRPRRATLCARSTLRTPRTTTAKRWNGPCPKAASWTRSRCW